MTGSASSETSRRRFPRRGPGHDPRVRRAGHGAGRNAAPEGDRRLGLIPALLAFAGGLWLAAGRRRKEVRAIGIGLIVAGVAVLVIRRVAGSYVVDGLVESDSVRPAVAAFWEILSDGLEGAWVGIVLGLIVTLGAWITGEGERARAMRRAAGPWLARPGLAWGVFAGVLLLVIWALPLHRFSSPRSSSCSRRSGSRSPAARRWPSSRPKGPRRRVRARRRRGASRPPPRRRSRSSSASPGSVPRTHRRGVRGREGRPAAGVNG